MQEIPTTKARVNIPSAFPGRFLIIDYDQQLETSTNCTALTGSCVRHSRCQEGKAITRCKHCDVLSCRWPLHINYSTCHHQRSELKAQVHFVKQIACLSWSGCFLICLGQVQLGISLPVCSFHELNTNQSSNLQEPGRSTQWVNDIVKRSQQSKTFWIHNIEANPLSPEFCPMY